VTDVSSPEKNFKRYVQADSFSFCLTCPFLYRREYSKSEIKTGRHNTLMPFLNITIQTVEAWVN